MKSSPLKRLVKHHLNHTTLLATLILLWGLKPLGRALFKSLQKHLQSLKDELPDAKNFKQLKQWWKTSGSGWTERLRQVMIQHRNIGHDWQFDDAQRALLSQYCDANKLLVDCLNSDCYVSREVRQEIEETLLLPYSELQK